MNSGISVFCVVANSILTGLHPPDLCHNKVVVNIALGILQAFAGLGISMNKTCPGCEQTPVEV